MQNLTVYLLAVVFFLTSSCGQVNKKISQIDTLSVQTVPHKAESDSSISSTIDRETIIKLTFDWNKDGIKDTFKIIKPEKSDGKVGFYEFDNLEIWLSRQNKFDLLAQSHLKILTIFHSKE